MTKDRGFTLMEVLVALVLLTLFALVAYRALDAVLNTQRQATARMDKLNELANAFALMDADLSNATIRPNPLVPSSSGFQSLIEQDGAAQFDFVRLLPDDADQGLQRIGYQCKGETLSRLIWPDTNSPADIAKEFTLLGGLRACTFKYLDTKGQWLTGWLAQMGSPFPRAVELNIVEADGTPIRRVMGVQ
jgi:general secretion pathway protein J